MRGRLLQTTAAAGLALAFLVGTAAPSPAQTSPYPPGARGCRVSVNVTTPGARVTVSCVGFRPRAVVRILLRSTPMDLGSTTTDSAGDLTEPVTIPASAEPGEHHLVLTGPGASGGTREVSVPLTLVASGGGSAVTSSEGSGGGAGGGGGLLSRTGAAGTVPLTAAALNLLAVGTAALVVARRRQTS